MLTWTATNGAWFANGFRIQRTAPAVWSLYEASAAQSSAVMIEPSPLASLPTLSACKYKAEEIHDRNATSALRGRLLSALVTSVAIWVLASGNPVVVVVALVIGASSLLELLMTWFEGKVGGAREVLQ